MTRALKIFFVVIGGVIGVDVVLTSALSFYDSDTRQQLLRMVAQELQPHASAREMDDFMRRHTTRYALDETYHHEYGGFIPQTRLDRFLFDRKVQIVLKVSENNTLMGAEVQVYYTGL